MTHPDHAESLRLIEALLFASSVSVTEMEIADRLPEGSDVAALLAELEHHYRDRGVMLAKIAGGWTFRTAPDLAQRLKLETTGPRRLSRAAVETLAIVAYPQPATRAVGGRAPSRRGGAARRNEVRGPETPGAGRRGAEWGGVGEGGGVGQGGGKGARGRPGPRPPGEKPRRRGRSPPLPMWRTHL